MAVQLTKTQLRELDRARVFPLELEDPRNGTRYVLVSVEVYELMLPLMRDVAHPSQRRAKLVKAMKDLSPEMRSRLVELKDHGEALRGRPDLLWYLLLEAASTLGNSRGYAKLFGNRPLLDSVSYAELKQLTSTARRKRLLSAFQAAKVRMPNKKADWLAANFDRIEEMGGVERATQVALALGTHHEKLDLMMSFQGIGEKYGRNVWMGIYDPAFRDTVAIDQRIKNVTEALGYSFPDYADHEQFYRDIAREAGLEPWEVDRLLYWFTDYFIKAME